MIKVFIVFEVEEGTRNIVGVPYGTFANFDASENFVKDMYTKFYNRYMMISESPAWDTWPFKIEDSLANPPKLTYYHQIDGKMERL